MHHPPFARSLLASAAYEDAGGATAPASPPGAGRAASGGRTRLGQLDPHLYCSIIGTCLGPEEVRRLLSRFQVVQERSDSELHHEAVGLAAQDPALAKALHKALDQRHEAVLRRFEAVRDTAGLLHLWGEALQRGQIAGAYWAVLTHRAADTGLRQQVFGDVHMLSHRIGAANRMDLRRLAALESHNQELRDRLDELGAAHQQALAQRERQAAVLLQECTQLRLRLAQAAEDVRQDRRAEASGARAAADLVAVHTQRRERAEQAAEAAAARIRTLEEALADYARHVHALQQELDAAEAQLRADAAADDSAGPAHLDAQQRRVLYVGGRPSSTPALRALVLRLGGEFRHFDGGLEERKGLLAAAVAWAQLVAFPTDCIDHDSAGNLKRLCQRHGIAFLPLRSASVTSLAAALAALRSSGTGIATGPCRHHG